MDAYIKFNKKVDIVSPRSEGDKDSPVLRENYFSRNGRLETVKGTERVFDGLFAQRPTGAWRYYSRETGVQTPKTIVYTQDGKLYRVNEIDRTTTLIKEGLNTNAYPKAVIYKYGEQYYFYLVDGVYLWEWDGNASYLIYDKTPKQNDGTSYNPIDIVEHLDRIVLLTERQVLISANLLPTVFDSADDSIEIILGTGKGINRDQCKLGDRLYFFNTEGCFILNGDVLSAVASTFSVDMVDPSVKVTVGNTGQSVENAYVYIGHDLELYSFNGQTKELLSHSEQLKTRINPAETYLLKSASHYDPVDKRYYLSVVENVQVSNNLEIVYDSIENKIDFIKGRNVSCYCQYDQTREPNELLLGGASTFTICYANRGKNFDGVGIRRRLRTRDVYFSKGDRGRITAFYPEVEPVGNRTLDIRYLLDGRLSGSVIPTTMGYSGADTTTYQAISTSGHLIGTLYTAPIDGFMRSIMVYVHSPSGNGTIGVAIYNVSGGTLGSLVTANVSVPVGSSTAKWYEVYFGGGGGYASQVSLSGGTQYFLTARATSNIESRFYYNAALAGSSFYGTPAPTYQTDRQYLIKANMYGDPTFTETLAGEQRGLGFINITNQSQYMDRIRPKINYAHGSSITFEIDEAVPNLSYSLIGIGMDVTLKHPVKGKKVSQ